MPAPIQSPVLCLRGCGRHAGRGMRGLCRACWDNRRVRAATPHAPHRNGSAPRCLHCGQRPQSRPRGLCGVCYLDLSIRQRYPPIGLGARFAPVAIPTPAELRAAAEQVLRERTATAPPTLPRAGVLDDPLRLPRAERVAYIQRRQREYDPCPEGEEEAS